MFCTSKNIEHASGTVEKLVVTICLSRDKQLTYCTAALSGWYVIGITVLTENKFAWQQPNFVTHFCQKFKHLTELIVTEPFFSIYLNTFSVAA